MLRRLLLTILFILVVFRPVVTAQESKPINVGIVLDGPSILTDEILDLVKQEILSLTKDEFDVRFPVEKTIISDWTIEANKQAISRLLKDDNVDILITLGIISTSDVIKRGDLPKPTIATVVLDADIQNAPKKGNTSGVKNLSYTALTSDFKHNIEQIKHNINTKHLTVITNIITDLVIPELKQHLKENLEKLGATVELLPLGESIQETLTKQLRVHTRRIYISNFVRPLARMASIYKLTHVVLRRLQ